MHDIERYGIGKSELTTWRNAKHATLLFAPRGDEVTLTLLADDLWVGQHTVGAGQFAEALAGYAGLWHSGAGAAGAGAKERSFVSAFSIAGQGVDTPVVPHTPPKGFPGMNYLVHQQMRAVVTVVTESPERG